MERIINLDKMRKKLFIIKNLPNETTFHVLSSCLLGRAVMSVHTLNLVFPHKMLKQTLFTCNSYVSDVESLHMFLKSEALVSKRGSVCHLPRKVMSKKS